VLLGPQADYFAADEIGRFLATTFTVSSESNRMGMRLNGGLIRHAKGFNITSDAITFGSIQIMGNGQPLVMMADRPTTGGYPKIATIISVDLPRIGRLQAGATFGFSAVSVADAEVARKTMIGEIQARVAQIRDISANSSPNFFEYNLISGVFDALS
jgi:allophanate hydrolase subunit 2